MTQPFSYCVAIRTLGTAGEKYLSTLKSAQSQTIPPKKILVYIAEGYDLPKETIGIEQYIYAKKGMIAQRALPYNEIDTEYILFLDDDLSFPPDMVEKLYHGLCEYNADCISPNIYPNHKMSLPKKIVSAWGAFTLPMHSKTWAFKVRKNGSFSYNNNPTRNIYYSQTASGACSLCKKTIFQNIHFDHECFYDMLGFPLGEDQLLYNKIFKNGYKLLVHYAINLIHLDGKTGHIKTPKSRLIAAGKTDYILWHRTCFNLKTNTTWDKILCLWSFTLKIITKFSYKLIIGTLKGYPNEAFCYIQGLQQGKQFTTTTEYKTISNFII